MSNDKQQRTSTSAPTEGTVTVTGGSNSGGKEPIPVAVLRFRVGENVDIPGKQGATSISATKNHSPGQSRHTIEYLPWMRQYRVTYYAAGTTEAKVLLVHETWATCELP